MKTSTTLTCMTFLVWLLLFSSCKKEKPDTSLKAASLIAGRAGIRFTTNENYNGRKTFDVSNTSTTSAISKTAAGNTNIRNIILETTEITDNIPTRKVIIDMVVPNQANTNNGNISINLAVQSGPPPVAFMVFWSYSLFGITRQSRSGTMTITRLTATEIEGTFTGTADASSSSGLSGLLTITKGSFAGKF